MSEKHATVPAQKKARSLGKKWPVDVADGDQIVLWNGECFILGFHTIHGWRYQGLHLNLRPLCAQRVLRPSFNRLLRSMRSKGMKVPCFERRMAGGRGITPQGRHLIHLPS
jgi:hypothetical protein